MYVCVRVCGLRDGSLGVPAAVVYLCVCAQAPLLTFPHTVIREVQIPLPYLTDGKVEALNPMLSCVAMDVSA